MRMTPLQDWVQKRIGAPPAPEALWDYQRRAIRETLAWAKTHSRFYSGLFRNIDPASIRTPQDMGLLAGTWSSDLRGGDEDFLCVSQSEVARVVTLESSGTTGVSKRIHFTDDDLERTTDFFQQGMSTFTRPGQRVMIFMPGPRFGSVGDLLSKALKRLGAESLVHGPVADPEEALAAMREYKPQVLVGIPIHVLALARRDSEAGRQVESVLLCSDNVPLAVVRAVEEAWGCEVFTHWGMTETGLGGGVECEAHEGYHLREVDMYVEVADPWTGSPLPPGRLGEVLVTTFARRGMPLIRYHTGDEAMMIDGECSCGSVLRRLGRIRGRLGAVLRLTGGQNIGIAELDEILFGLPGLLDFKATLKSGGLTDLLSVEAFALPGRAGGVAAAAVKSLQDLAEEKGFAVSVSTQESNLVSGMAKRLILDKRGKNV